MAINIEVKHRLKALEDRIKALEDRQKPVDQPVITVPVELEKGPRPTRIEVNRRLCPHCGIKPNHYFHVKNCPGKQKQDGDDRNRDPGNT